MFIGQSTHQIDEKGRIRIPSRFKDELGDKPFITSGTNGCLFVYPAAFAQQVLSAKFKENDFAVDAKAMRLLMSNAIFAEEDKQGRILLPNNLIRHAGIKKNIVTIGAFDRVEIWSQEVWTQYSEEADLDAAIKLMRESSKG
ncbi:MAG: division/cell wall cluster transcriptional repressor MraZ [Firmicutes bacterium]|nr:division/cell wall cluster transcriptional repressor MraZ [Bacillota bacterium]